MEFCPKCGSVIMGKNCARCSYKSDKEVKIETTQVMAKKHDIPLAVVDEKESEVRPIIDTPCKKCGNHQSYFWTKQTRSGDEAETRFFKCTKCNHQWREYR